MNQECYFLTFLSMIELEKTYLAKYLPEGLQECKSKEILDIYLPKSSDHAKLRVRKNGEKYEITKKTLIDNDPSKQLENTIPLTKEEFEELNLLPGKRIRKIRYYYPFAGRMAEVDVFQDDLKGLVLVDFEFEFEHEKDVFEMPDFCLADVTIEDAIAGGMLCGKHLLEVLPHLEKYGYSQVKY